MHGVTMKIIKDICIFLVVIKKNHTNDARTHQYQTSTLHNVSEDQNAQHQILQAYWRLQIEKQGGKLRGAWKMPCPT